VPPSPEFLFSWEGAREGGGVLSIGGFCLFTHHGGSHGFAFCGDIKGGSVLGFFSVMGMVRVVVARVFRAGFVVFFPVWVTVIPPPFRRDFRYRTRVF